MNYTEVTSAFIIGLIRESSWQQHEKIDDLIHLQKFIVHPPKSFNSGWAFSHLKSTYPDEFLKLLEEYSPLALEQELTERQNVRKELEILQSQRELELEESKGLWVAAGGRMD
jgi:hypothetical protein